MNCPNCSTTIGERTKFCPHCATPVQVYVDASPRGLDTTAAATAATGRSPVANRYVDLYRVTRLLVGLGSTIKVLGVVLGIAILFLVLYNQSSTNNRLTIGTFIFGGVFGLFVGGLIFLLGTLISAQGQILFAQTDCAVHTSPFLNDQEKANAMSLPTVAVEQQLVGPEREKRLSKVDAISRS